MASRRRAAKGKPRGPRPGRPSPPVSTALGKAAFLLSYAKLGNIKAACEAAKVGRRTHFEWIKADQEYAAAVLEARDLAADVLEEEARRRAVTGVLEPVFQVGEEVGKIRKYSDTLLIFLMKGARPEVYRERFEHSGSLSTTPAAQMSTAELAAAIAEAHAHLNGGRHADQDRPTEAGTERDPGSDGA